MCGRYYVDETTAEEVRNVVRWIDKSLIIQAGDVHPSDQAVVLTGIQPCLTAEQMAWGFPQYTGKGLLINARAETIFEKSSFRDSARQRRCILPAGHFYEWSRAKEKAEFYREDSRVIYMAGVWNRFEDGNRFVVLTTQANASVSPVHDRMPVILKEHELQDWVYEERFARYILERTPILLKRRQEYEQQSLFDFEE
ncbi:MAG: SOS response-associated peptidase [Lachnospiraceae bacterium]|nr:SOS response-associated peptidase [Lachnospiraceae bacterium]